MASTFPVRRGQWALLRVLAGEGDDAVYLAVSPEVTRPQVIKPLPRQPETQRTTRASREERRFLARMRFAHLAAVTASPEVERDGGFVMEHVAGRSLAAISRRAEDYSVLLPPELGLIVAHDAFAAAELFHGFEGAGRLHGNITARTILVAYPGEVKLAGYRPGLHPAAGIDTYVAKDLKPLATILSELAFERFPQELAFVVPHLLEDDVTPEEAVAAVRTFLQGCQPSAGQRRAVATWLADLFLGEREAEAQEEARLMAAAAHLLGPRRRVGKRVSWVGGTTAVLALAGGVSLLAHRWGPEPRAMGNGASPLVAVARETVRPPGTPAGEPPDPFVSARLPLAAPPAAGPAPSRAATPPAFPPSPPAPSPPEVLPVIPPAPATASPVPSLPVSRPAADSPKREATRAAASRLLREADAAFVAGDRISAVNLALQAVRAGGRVRAHLALGEYYRSMLRYREALNHYRAALAIEPDNQLGLAGLELLEKKVAACPSCR